MVTILLDKKIVKLFGQYGAGGHRPVSAEAAANAKKAAGKIIQAKAAVKKLEEKAGPAKATVGTEN